MSKIYNQSGLLLICSFLIGSCFCTGCGQSSKDSKRQNDAAFKYGILINAKKGERVADRIVWTNTLDSGVIDAENNFTNMSGKLGTHVIVSNGLLFNFNKATHQFSKYRFNGQQLIAEDSLKLNGFDYLSSSVSLDSNKLYLCGHSAGSADTYAIIDTRSMQMLRSDSLKLPVAAGRILVQTFVRFVADKLYLGYSSFDENYEYSSDTSYLAVFDYPGFRRLHIAKDTRSAFPGTGVNGLLSSFSDQKGDLYIIASPIFYLGNHPTAATGFYKVKKNARDFAENYFFNLSSLAGGAHFLGITYAGNGKVIMATTRYPSTKKSDFYVADVYAKTLTPLLKNKNEPNYNWATGGMKEGDKAWFIVNEDNYAQVYCYNALTGKLSKGAVISGIVSNQSSYLMFPAPAVSLK